MKLSEAIKHGATLRGESHQDRFVHVEGEGGGLRSDAWGAACEAVQPAVARFNWNHRDLHKFERSMDALRGVQQHYFARYWQMPAICPGSQQRFIAMGGRIVGKRDEQPLISVYEKGQTAGSLGGVTSECELVEHMAGMVDHLFYAHGWSREQVAAAVEWYEQTRTNAALVRNFEHYAVN
jgi:4-hydroxyphenylpyruvate dioxygenase-like putative hemolysin